MINGIEGIPGSGKSYEATVYHVLEALRQGRLVVTNLPLNVEVFAAIDPSYRRLIELRRRPRPIRGTWDANRMDDDGKGLAFELWPLGDDGKPRLELAAERVPVFGHVWDFFHEWKHPETGQGPLFIIDECHVALPKMGTDVQVLQWFKLHRHFNIDVLLMTQSFRDMSQEIARLIAMLVRCRKADFLGKPKAYVRKVQAGYRGAGISTEERPYKPEFFALYTSHTQGNSVSESMASDVSPFLVKWKRFTVAWFIIGALLCVWLLWPASKEKPKAAAKPVAVAAPLPTSAKALPGPATPAPAAAPGPEVAAVPEDPEPLPEKSLHMKGTMTLGGKSISVFVVSQNGQPVATYTDADLRSAGYGFRATGACTGIIEWKGKPRPVSCDSPAVQVVNAPGA